MGVHRQEGVVGMHVCVGGRVCGVRACTNAHTYVSLSKSSNITVRTKMPASEVLGWLPNIYRSVHRFVFSGGNIFSVRNLHKNEPDKAAKAKFANLQKCL